MASTLRLDTRRALKDGTYPVQIVVGYGTNIYLSTGIYVAPDEWDSVTKRCTGKGAKKLNDVLTTLLTSVGSRIFDLMEHCLVFRKQHKYNHHNHFYHQQHYNYFLYKGLSLCRY